LKEKLRKVQELVNRGATAGERAAAFAQMQRLYDVSPLT
jgi:hypothetical protein